MISDWTGDAEVRVRVDDYVVAAEVEFVRDPQEKPKLVIFAPIEQDSSVRIEIEGDRSRRSLEIRMAPADPARTAPRALSEP